MLEPPTPAGEPFGTQQEEENNRTSDFESVCISLVERGWKIMPRKGTYPLSKKGPPYINLVDPRGNRKSVRVTDEGLWEKLRAAELRRTSKKSEEKEAVIQLECDAEVNSEAPQTGSQGTQFQIAEKSDNIETPAETVIESPDPIQTSSEIATTPVVESPTPSVETFSGQEEKPSVESPTNDEAANTEINPVAQEETKAEIVENPPREFQSFALSSPGLQKSIFDLGFETLLTALQSETLTPAQIVTKIQEWSMESKNLLEFVRKWQERTQPKAALPDTSEKDELISELQNTLKETEEKLEETLQSLREM